MASQDSVLSMDRCSTSTGRPADAAQQVAPLPRPFPHASPQHDGKVRSRTSAPHLARPPRPRPHEQRQGVHTNYR